MSRYAEAQREELFAGAEPRQQQRPQDRFYGEKTLDEMDNRQVMQVAVKTHQDTTATYRRGLQVRQRP
jgi:hypothetical protein